MFLDMAYAVRTRLKRLGYESPDVVGVLFVPPADPTLTPSQALGNTFAALTTRVSAQSPASTGFFCLPSTRVEKARTRSSPSFFALSSSAAR